MDFSMPENKFLPPAEGALGAMGGGVDGLEADVEFERSGNFLTLEFENRTKLIVNLQPPMHEVWLAAKAGGFHYRYVDGAWRNTRDGSEFFEALSQYASEQAGEPIRFSA